MDYPLGADNWICRTFGHRYGKPYRDYVAPGEPLPDFTRQTCWLDGHTVPPFRKVRQTREGGYLPADQQPPGAI